MIGWEAIWTNPLAKTQPKYKCRWCNVASPPSYRNIRVQEGPTSFLPIKAQRSGSIVVADGADRTRDSAYILIKGEKISRTDDLHLIKIRTKANIKNSNDWRGSNWKRLWKRGREGKKIFMLPRSSDMERNSSIHL